MEQQRFYFCMSSVLLIQPDIWALRIHNFTNFFFVLYCIHFNMLSEFHS